MYKIKIWNKKDSINGVDAKSVINSHKIKETDDIFLVLNNYDRVLELNFVDVIRTNFNLSQSLTKEQVAQEYLKIREEERLQAEKEQVTLEEQERKISILEAENEKLKVEQEQQNEEILVNMLANTEMFEIILGMMPMALSIEDKNTKNNGGSNMVEVYVTLIIKGVKTIEDVPLVIREQVIERLKQLEVPVK